MSGNQTAQDGTLSSITGRSVYKSWHELVNQETGKAPANFSAVDTAKTGKISVEEWTVRFGSANGFERYDANHDGEIDQAEFLKAKTTMALAEIVKSAMGEGWSQIEINDISVKDTSGHGGARLYRVSAPGATPEAVALKAKSHDNSRIEGRVETATMIFSDLGVGPKRLAQGDDWTIEPWEGLGEPALDSVEKFEMYGRLFAQIHKLLPIEWYDEWREDVCTRQPWMKGMPLGSWVWIQASQGEGGYHNALPEILARMSKDYAWSPVTEAGSRIVTVHGDMHKRNMLQMADCMRAIDYDATCVSHAVNDLGYALGYVADGWFDEETGFFNLPDEEMLVRKRAFIASYLSGMGDAATPADVDALLLDAELCMSFPFWGDPIARVSPLSQEDKETLKMTEHDDKGLTFERIDNKLVVRSSDAEPRGLGIFPGDGKVEGSGWQCHRATLVPVSEALEINDSDGHITASINGQQATFIAGNLQLKHGTLMEFAFPMTGAALQEQHFLDVSLCCLDENGRISFRHSSTDFPNSEGLRLCHDEGPSDAEMTQAFMSKFDSLEEYVTQARGDAAMQERLFLKGRKKAYKEWLDSAQK